MYMVLQHMEVPPIRGPNMWGFHNGGAPTYGGSTYIGLQHVGIEARPLRVVAEARPLLLQAAPEAVQVVS